MSKDKPIVHELSTEDLLKIVTSSDEEVVMEKTSEAAKFIYALSIRAGRTKISAQLIYFTYKNYKGWRNKKQSKPVFFKDFNKYFKPERDKDGMFYYLEDKPFDLSKDTWWLMRKEIRDKKKSKKLNKK